jgi:hypothetical protein
MQDEVKVGEATIFGFIAPQTSMRARFKGGSWVKLFYFTPFNIKRLQLAPEASGEALPNGTLDKSRDNEMCTLD